MAEQKTFVLDIDMSPNRRADDPPDVLVLDPKPRGRAAIHDPAGEAWHADARARWSKAERDDPETPFAAYDAPPLPKWFAPAHVKRELLGRFLLDRDTGVLHDVERATEGCAVDAIRNGTFVHFASELVAGPDERDCPLCVGEVEP